MALRASLEIANGRRDIAGESFADQKAPPVFELCAKIARVCGSFGNLRIGIAQMANKRRSNLNDRRSNREDGRMESKKAWQKGRPVKQTARTESGQHQ
jgi:hypothetical protein